MFDLTDSSLREPHDIRIIGVPLDGLETYSSQLDASGCSSVLAAKAVRELLLLVGG